MGHSFLTTLTPFVTALSLLTWHDATNSSNGMKLKKGAALLSDLGYLLCTYVSCPPACSQDDAMVHRVLQCTHSILFSLNNCLPHSNFTWRSNLVVSLVEYRNERQPQVKCNLHAKNLNLAEWATRLNEGIQVCTTAPQHTVLGMPWSKTQRLNIPGCSPCPIQVEQGLHTARGKSMT